MMSNFPVSDIRNDFPILERKVNNNDLVYFDNAATTQKPNTVIDALSNYYKNINSNELIIHQQRMLFYRE